MLCGVPAGDGVNAEWTTSNWSAPLNAAGAGARAIVPTVADDASAGASAASIAAAAASAAVACAISPSHATCAASIAASICTAATARASRLRTTARNPRTPRFSARYRR